MFKRLTPVLLLGFLCSACATAGTANAPHRNRDVIAAEEIASVDVPTAYDLIRRLRPEFLRPRGVSGVRGSISPSIYINGIKAPDGLQQLQNINREDVLEIRWLSATDATTRFGTGNSGGAIMVKTKG